MKRMILAAVLSLSLALSAPAPLLYAEEIQTETQEEETDSSSETQTDDEKTDDTEAAEPELKTYSFDADSAPDNDQLFQQYVNRTFGISSSTKTIKRAPRRTRLSISEQPLYDALKAKVEAAANGELSSSDFTFSVSDVYSTFLSTQYSASDLGVTALYNDDGSFTDEAQTVTNEICYPDLGNVLKYVFSDCPYDCYWIDGTAGWSSSYLYFYASRSSEGTDAISFTPAYSSISYSIKVSKDYSKTGETDTTDIDTTKTSATKTAVANAKQIVTDAASKSDYDKLKYYSDQICALTSYNDDAAKNNPAYGNPWQLIYVFDGDSTTNVVCEGYAKAFKYLCDQSTFNSSDIACYTVSGNMSGGTGSGSHMWNVVHMDDGFNYIVDVTNSDEGTVGAYSGLFLGNAQEDDYNTEKQYYVTAYSSSKDEAGTKIWYWYDDGTREEYSAQERAIRKSPYGTASGAKTVTEPACLGYVVAGTDQVRFSAVFVVPDSYKEDAAHYHMEMSAGDVTTSGTLKEAMATPYYVNDTEGYKFSISLPVKQMADTVHMQLYGPDNEPVGDEVSLSVKDCLEKIALGGSYADDEKATARAMLNYGAAAQEYFHYNTDNLANAGLGTADQKVSEVTASDIKDLIENSGVNNTVESILSEQDGQTTVEYEGSNLKLDTGTNLQTYFRFPGRVDGVQLKETTYYGNSSYTGCNDAFSSYATQTGTSDIWCLQASDIVAGSLTNQYEYQLLDSSGNELLKVRVSPMIYVYKVLNSSESDARLVKLCRALYDYYMSARSAYNDINMPTETVDVTYDANGGYVVDQKGEQVSSTTLTLKSGDTISGHYTPQNADSSLVFAGWTYDKSGSNAVGDNDTASSAVTVYAQWEKGITVTFNANGGYFYDSDTRQNVTTRKVMAVSGGTYTVADPENSDSSKGFNGWYYDAACTNAVGDLSSFHPTADTTVYAGWIDGYTITFNANGGKFNGDVTSITRFVTAGSGIGSVNDWPYGNGDKLATNWYFDAACTQLVNSGEIYDYVPTSSMTLYAGWGEKCTITFNANGGTFQYNSTTDTYTGYFGKGRTNIGSEYPVSSDSAKTFGGWYYDAACTNAVGDLSDYTVTGDVTFYAGWEDGCTITYNANGGYFPYNNNETTVSFTVTKGTTYPPYQTPTANESGKAFNGWYYDAACTNAVGNLSSYTVTDDVTLYAGWTEGYTITFDANGGYFTTSSGTSETRSETFAKGSTWYYYKPSNTDSTLGFTGWYTDQECTKGIYTNTIPDGDITVYAGWSTYYTVTYDANGGYFTGTYQSQTYSNASTIQQRAASGGDLYSMTPQNADSKLTFSGWFTDQACTNAVDHLNNYNLTGDTTFYAGWLDTSSITLYPVTNLAVSTEGIISFDRGQNGDNVYFGAYIVKDSNGYGMSWSAMTSTASSYYLNNSGIFQDYGTGAYTIKIKTGATKAEAEDFSSGVITSISYTYTGSSSSSSSGS